jgi:hypothetical protein
MPGSLICISHLLHLGLTRRLPLHIAVPCLGHVGKGWWKSPRPAASSLLGQQDVRASSELRRHLPQVLSRGLATSFSPSSLEDSPQLLATQILLAPS